MGARNRWPPHLTPAKTLSFAHFFMLLRGTGGNMASSTSIPDFPACVHFTPPPTNVVYIDTAYGQTCSTALRLRL